MALGNAAVHQEIDAAGVRRDPDQAAGAGDAVFRADVGDFHGYRRWGSGLNIVIIPAEDGFHGCWVILSHVLIDLYYLVQPFADFGKK